MKKLILGTVILVALGGCTSDEPVGDRSAAQRVDADDTGRNAAGQPGSGLTATDQSNAPADLEVTQRIRQAIVQSEELSTDAKNVKVITQNGHVTLRGPVESEAEKAAIEGTAVQVAGTGRVTSELEVESE